MKVGYLISAAVAALLVGIFVACLFIVPNLTDHSRGENEKMGIVIDSLNWEKETGQIKAYVRNLDSFTELTEIYVNRKLDNQVTIVPRQLTLNQTAEITLTEVYWIMPKQITIAVHASNFTMVHTQTFIGFEMLRLYWNEHS